jgi:hypothetical protein
VRSKTKRQKDKKTKRQKDKPPPADLVLVIVIAPQTPKTSLRFAGRREGKGNGLLPNERLVPPELEVKKTKRQRQRQR